MPACALRKWKRQYKKHLIIPYLALYGLLLKNTLTILIKVFFVFIIIFKDSKKEGRLAPSFLPTVK
jgi:hypothetical protein